MLVVGGSACVEVVAESKVGRVMLVTVAFDGDPTTTAEAYDADGATKLSLTAAAFEVTGRETDVEFEVCNTGGIWESATEGDLVNCASRFELC
jgi:hypothetical protein